MGDCGLKGVKSWRRERISEGRLSGTVPKTDTGGREEDSQALEGTRVKELGTNAHVTSGEVWPSGGESKGELLGGCREMLQATVYQKHRSLRIGNETYRD